MARKYPNDFTPDGVDIETAFANDDLELKDILSQIANVGAINLSGEKRQSVLSAHVDSSGNPDYITATGLNVSIDGSTTPVILAFAAGFDDKGSVDLVDAIKTNVSAWTVPSNATVYLYVDKDASTGLLSYGYSTLPDLYQKAAPTAVLDQHWYDTNACKMKRYNGSAWEEKRRVFVGQVVAGASTAAVTVYPIGSRVTLQVTNLTATGAINETQAADVASAATVDLGALLGNFANITGTTAITSLGTVSAGVKRSVKFTGVLTLTYNAASLILPGAANITTAAGDTAEFVSLGGGNWQCTRYTRADGSSIANVPIASTAQAQAGTDNTVTISPLRLREGFNAIGTAPIYACRAWVNFNGTGTVAVRASGNVSSVADNGVGDYTINFATPMPDANYVPKITGDSNGYGLVGYVNKATAPSASALRIGFRSNDTSYNSTDCEIAAVAIVR